MTDVAITSNSSTSFYNNDPPHPKATGLSQVFHIPKEQRTESPKLSQFPSSLNQEPERSEHAESLKKYRPSVQVSPFPSLMASVQPHSDQGAAGGVQSMPTQLVYGHTNSGESSPNYKTKQQQYRSSPKLSHQQYIQPVQMQPLQMRQSSQPQPVINQHHPPPLQHVHQPQQQSQILYNWPVQSQQTSTAMPSQVAPPPSYQGIQVDRQMQQQLWAQQQVLQQHQQQMFGHMSATPSLVPGGATHHSPPQQPLVMGVAQSPQQFIQRYPSQTFLNMAQMPSNPYHNQQLSLHGSTLFHPSHPNTSKPS